MAKAGVLTAQADDFPRWYQDVVAKAELADNGPVRGTMVILPYGFAIWERMQAEMDARIKAAGAENAYFPLFIPLSYLRKEADHVEGFAPELAIVTHGGGKELDEPIVVRPTSETVIAEYMAKYIQSHRDLPLLWNSWNNVVRWELRPRLFLRTTEFLWQEGHTAHATYEDAKAYAQRIFWEAYVNFMLEVLAIPVFPGNKTARERFPGAVNTMTVEAMMGDGKALQMGTSHEFGQNFAKAFDIQYADPSGQLQHCWTTSWGTSTRMVGGLIMGHGDDAGLRLPPAVAPHQVVVCVVKAEDGAGEAAATLADELRAGGLRVKLDDRVETSFGRRAIDWDIKGAPLRIDVGPRDLANGSVTVARRDNSTKETVAIESVAASIPETLRTIHADLLAQATARRDERTVDVTSVADAAAAGANGFARLPWATLRAGDGETELRASGVTVRCLQRPDGTLPEGEDEPDTVALVARAY